MSLKLNEITIEEPIVINGVTITPEVIKQIENFQDFHPAGETKNRINELSCKLASFQEQHPDDLEAMIGNLPDGTFFMFKDLYTFFNALEEAGKEAANEG